MVCAAPAVLGMTSSRAAGPTIIVVLTMDASLIAIDAAGITGRPMDRELTTDGWEERHAAILASSW
jgi:hypothetical protein